ncbi:MAG: hypothetical protein ABL929_10575 [Ferruginibacter sp.]|nr:hypothetical protein [Ferruginibacter sp.]
MSQYTIYQISQTKPTLLEKFGLYYLQFFKKNDSDHNVFNLSDNELANRVNKITLKGIVLSSIVGITCVYPTVWVDVFFAKHSNLVHYSWLAATTIMSIAIELYLLFLISLKAVYQVSEIVNIHASQKDLEQDGLFSVKNILARTALELPDPELKIIGIDPFKRISKKNLLILGLLYKAKIFVTNVIVKYALIFFIGKTIFGVSVLYEAILVECFWNSVVIRKVVLEARLRLFGFALANKIGQNILNNNILNQLSVNARIGCIRAIGNAVVLAQNYHPNMILLLVKFQQILKINESNKYDDFEIFLETLKTVSKSERFFLLDLFTIAAAFDGKLSVLEKQNLKTVYENDYEIYLPRLTRLTSNLTQGKLHAAMADCSLDFETG